MGNTIALPIICTISAYGVLFLSRAFYRTWKSPLRFIDGPESFNFVVGHSIVFSDVPEQGDQWRKRYGETFMAKGLFWVNDLHTTDLKAVSHVLSHASLYSRTPEFVASLSRILGEGLLSVSLDPHRRQRKILNPAFNLQRIRLMNEIFFDNAILLRDLLSADVEKAGGTATINLAEMFRRVTLDIMGQAGFGYKFNSLESGGQNEGDLGKAFHMLFRGPNANLNIAVQLAQGLVPILQYLPLPGWRNTQSGIKTLRSVGAELLHKAKAEARVLGEKDLGSGRDLLSILVKANMSADIQDSQRLSDDEVIAQIPTFLLAGHDTSSIALGWALHALSHHPEIQDKLRRELLSIDTDTPTMDELNGLPFFENVVKEAMRLYSPVPFVQRTALQDDVLPLGKPYVDRWGVSHEFLPITKGQCITIPIQAINIDKETWGDDALEFKPERWDNLPEAVHSVPGVWGNQLTFVAGAHSCIGFQFSVAEQKVILFSLLRAFEFLPGTEPVSPVISGQLARPNSFVSDGKGGRVSSGGLSIVLKAYKGSSL
ncbi:unnamed protein product [Mycena citricolor]|uniref:Cytochrome P450 n=1 Tax=Mycena citricolor TaxID=2018698 RepID=A0AAD2HJ91_9AGAR|nr:unnamed protein product [Mycena citricolor]